MFWIFFLLDTFCVMYRRSRERTALCSLSLADIKVICLQQNPSTDSPGIAERAEYHVQSHPQTFPRGLAPDYRAVGTMLGRRGKTLFAPQASLPPGRRVQKATAVFGRAGGRLVVPNTGKRPTWDLRRPRIRTAIQQSAAEVLLFRNHSMPVKIDKSIQNKCFRG